MLTLRPLTCAVQASVYYERDDYYVDGVQLAPSSWWGEGARRLRLSGPVDRDSFRELLEGRLPNGAVLEHGSGRHRPGVDLTFSAPKSVSIAALVGGDERILKAHEAAVTAALEYLQETAPRARNAVGGTNRLEQSKNLVVARFSHDTSRALDPQLHSHCVVLNVTRREDGEWRALANEELFRSKMIGGAVYRAELARRLRSLGYETVRTHADGRFEIGGLDQAQLDAFSKRRREILAHLHERGLDGHQARDAAARATRDKKREVDRAALRREWRNVAEDLGMDLAKLRGPAFRRSAGATRGVADDVLDRALARLTERNVVVSENKLLVAALNLGIGEVKLTDVRRSLARKLDRDELVAAHSRKARDPFQRMFTTDQELDNELALVASVERGRQQVAPLVPDREIERMLRAIDERSVHPLTQGQRDAIELSLSTQDRLIGIQGYAGTGKTTGALQHIRRVAEEKGLDVRGFAPTAAAASVLTQDAGIEAMTVARFLRSGPSQPPKGQLWIVDESSMLSNHDARAMLERAEQVGARVILVGDRDQLPSIDAGRAFGLLQDRGMQVAKVETVVRQENEQLKKAVVHTIARDHLEAMKEIAPRLVEIRGRDDRLAAIASAYTGLENEERDNALVLTGGNVDRRELNNLIRAMLFSRQELGRDTPALVLIPRDMRRDEKKDALQYREGDVVRFVRPYRTLGVKSGDYFTIKTVRAAEGVIELEDRAGETRRWRPSRASKVEIYEVQRRDLAAGDRIRFTRNERKLGRHNGQVGTIVSLDRTTRMAEVLVNGRRHHLDLNQHLHVEHAYASTVHAAQGRTADRVFLHFDSNQAHFAGHEHWYVAISRARKDVQIFTDDKQKLPELIRKSLGQEAALDVVQTPQIERAVPSDRDRVPRREREVVAAVRPHAERRIGPSLERDDSKPARAWVKPEKVKPARQEERERALLEIGPDTHRPQHVKDRERQRERQKGHGHGFYFGR